MTRLLKISIIFFVLFVHLFTDLIPAESMVLCFEKDGSIQVEKAYKNSCISNIDKTLSESTNLTVNHCSDCVDVPIFSGNTCNIASDSQLLSNNIHKIKSMRTILQPYLVYKVLENKKNDIYLPENTLLKSYKTVLESLDTVILLI